MQIGVVLQRAIAIQNPARGQIGSAGKPIIEPHSRTVIRTFPRTEARNQKLAGMSKMGRVLEHSHAFPQSAPYDLELAQVETANGFFQVANAPVHKLGRGARCGASKVSGIDEDCP